MTDQSIQEQDNKTGNVTHAILRVSLKVPFLCEPLIGVPALTFSHWLPIGLDNGIYITDGEVKLVLWFDIQTTWWASQPTEEKLKNYVNVSAHYINADLKITGIAPELAVYMESRDFKRLPSDEEQELQAAYESFGQRLLNLTLAHVNRLVAYARSRKGQYWLTEYEIAPGLMHQYYLKFEARGQFDDRNEFRFQPFVGPRIEVKMVKEERYITQHEWQDIQLFVHSSHRTQLVGELLAGAEQLAGQGHLRSAITEAVTALEVALYKFAGSKNVELTYAGIYGDRIGTPTIMGQIKHLGFSGAFGYLLPLILSDEVLPTSVIRDCQQAILLRQNIVHNGQREIDEVEASKALSSVRHCCKILEGLA